MNVSDDWDQHWEDTHFISSINPVNAYRERLILKNIPYEKNVSLHILDIGSGQGYLISKLSSFFSNAKIFGIDMSEKGIEYSQIKNPTAEFYHINLLNVDQKIPEVLYKKMDIAICTEVLEHLDNPLLFLNNAKSFLKNNSILIITVPGGPFSANDKHLGHRMHYTKHKLKALLENADFEVNHIYKAGFPFFNLYKIMLILRGQKIIADSKKQKLSLLERFLIKIFSILFRMNLSNSPWGWQLIAVLKPRS